MTLNKNFTLLQNFYDSMNLGYTPYPTISWDEWLFIQKYFNLFAVRCRYDNLPSETEDIVGFNSIIEMFMFFAPAVAWFKDKRLGVQCLPVTGNWKYNIAGMPTEWDVFGYNGFRKHLTEKDSVIMPNDSYFTIPFLHVQYNLKFLIELEKTHMQNIRRMRQPLILEIDEDEKKSAEKFKQELDNFKDCIKVRVRGSSSDKNRKTMGEKPFNSFAYDSNTEFIGDKLVTDFDVYENRIYQYFGYNNRNIEKKERLLVDEINAGNEVTNGYYESAMQAREKAIKKVNDMFGVDIKFIRQKEEFVNAVQSDVRRAEDFEERTNGVQGAVRN